MPASSSPVTTVEAAAQRNQNSAVGAITLLTAGFCSSGIFGIDGVCTKLKYQSRPIHMTPDRTCSQRTKNVHQAISGSLLYVPAMAKITMRMTTPAVMVLFKD